ncbi:MAG: alpha-1,2-fucosyltransferase [Thermovirgaceae bacterium]|nr:alpha-1,2-fucosyltransferase [Thermovirgaceae bacterium]
MIIVRLMGGLGNQMFQYAAGKRLALARGVELKLDTGFFERYPSRAFTLNAYPISEKVAARGEIRRLIYGGKPWWKLQTSKARRAAKESSPFIAREEYFHFNENLMTLGDRAYLDGYWQSERYFTDISEKIRTLFTPISVSRKARDMDDRISSCNSVSLHVRRGDYVHDVSASEVHVSLSTDYYMDAVAYLEAILGYLEIFLFSDDLPWVKKNLQLKHRATAVEDFSDVEDMWLMSRCRHNIIANSSFSWWGGWLNRNVGKTVIAPRDWFRPEKYDTVDLIPPGWVRL